MPAVLDITGERQHPDSKLIPLQRMPKKGWACLCEECGQETHPIALGRLRPVKTTGKFQVSCRRCATKRVSRDQRIDHTGETYGRQRAIKPDPKRSRHWIFYCAPDLGGCGKEKSIYGPNVWSQTLPVPTRSCGCYHREYTSSLFKEDLMGFQAEGSHLKVIAPAANRGETTCWKAQCDLFGNVIEIASVNLKGTTDTPPTYACGCRRPNQYMYLSGQIFGWLTAHVMSGRKNGDCYWDCTCKCTGKHVEVRADHLTRGAIVSCGCKPRGWDTYWGFIKDPELAEEPCSFYWVEVFGVAHNFGISNDIERRGGGDYTELFYGIWGTRAEARTLEAIMLIRSKFAEYPQLPPEDPSDWQGQTELRQPMDSDLTVAEIESVLAEIQKHGWRNTWLKHLSTD
ncbi:hypothetical protein SynRS9902_01658 [Synechococcus sp. RS9902]|nr:hypothetical protein SynRS9902_01658 [Synechococcus sp. RS9902]